VVRYFSTKISNNDSPDTALGLRPQGLSRLRYTGVRLVGLLGVVSLAIATCVPTCHLLLARAFALVGVVCSAVYALCLVFARHVDRWLAHLEFETQPEAKQRWARREAGRALAAYVYGIPVGTYIYIYGGVAAAVAQPLEGLC
jgi:hypothetical protein